MSQQGARQWSPEDPWLAGLYEEAFAVPPSGPLAGSVVLDFGQAAVGPIAATYLAMLGSLVIKVERPTGDHVRHSLPSMKGTSHTFIGNNLGQLGITLDLREPVDRESALALISVADVLIENFRGPEVMARYGLDYEQVVSINPGLVYLQSTAFGVTGPLCGMRSNEWVTQALGGFAVATGSADLPQFSHATSHLDWSGAMVNTLAVLAALLQRRREGKGFLVQTSQLGSTLFAGAPSWLAGHGASPSGLLEVSETVLTSDGGWVAVSASTTDELLALARLAGVDPPADVSTGSGCLALSLGNALRDLARATESDELLRALRAARVPCCGFDPSDRILERLRREPMIRNGAPLQELDTPWGPILTAAPPWTFGTTPARIAGPSPQLGQHTAAVLGRMKHNPRRAGPSETPRLTGATPPLPLVGTRVLVLGNDPATSLCGCIMEDLGADVRVLGRPRAQGWEPTGRDPARHDAVTRGLASRIEQWAFEPAPRNDEGWRDVLVTADVVLTGDDVGDHGPVTDDVVGAKTFGGIWCRISGWGPQLREPLSPASELTVQVLTGMNRFVGTPPGTGALGYPVVTVNTALAAAQAILAALLHAGGGGDGQRVAVSMVGVAAAISQWNIVGESGRPDSPVGRQLEAYEWPADHGYRLADRWCLIDLRDNEAGWMQLFVALGREDLLGDPRFNNIEALQRHRILLPSLMAAELSRTAFADMERFVRDELGGTIVPVLSPEEAAAHPQSQDLGVVLGGRRGERQLGLPVLLRSVASPATAGATTSTEAGSVVWSRQGDPLWR